MLEGMSSPGLVERAVVRGIAFLERAQLPSGEIPVEAWGKSDPSIFPTALAAHCLSFAPGAAQVRARSLDFLAAEMDSRGLWKHWPRTHPHYRGLPPDLDDTACASAALVRAGRTIPDNRGLLLANRNRRGLFRTWYLGAPELRHPLALFSFYRWTSARPFDVDAVVNANVLFYLGDLSVVAEHLRAILREKRETQCDKWYENAFAVHYFFARAGVRPDGPPGEPSNVLEHALAACVDLDRDITPLLDAQLDSGGWPAAGLYHGGRRRRRDGTFDPPHPDTPWWGSEELTTVFCIEALARRL